MDFWAGRLKDNVRQKLKLNDHLRAEARASFGKPTDRLTEEVFNLEDVALGVGGQVLEAPAVGNGRLPARHLDILNLDIGRNYPFRSYSQPFWPPSELF